MNARVRQLKLMNDFIRMSNGEEITMAWLTGGIPDDANEGEFPEFAADDELYNSYCDLFAKLVQKKGWRY